MPTAVVSREDYCVSLVLGRTHTSGRHSTDERLSVTGWRVPAAVSSLSLLLYGVVSILMYRQRIGFFDTAVLAQAVKGYAEFSAPIANTLSPGANQLGDHFSPILSLLAPVYWVFPDSLTLQLAQVMLVSLSVLLVTRTAVNFLGVLPGGLLGLAYTVSFGLQSAIQSGFHELAFATPLLALVGDRYLKRQYRAAAVWSLPLLLVKEDMGLVVGALGLVLFLRGARRLGAALCALACAYLAIVFLVVIPSLNPRGQYDFLAMALPGQDASGFEAIVLLLGEMFTPVRLVTVVLTLALTVFVGLRSPFLLLALPIALERIAAPWSYYWGPKGHYNLPVMTIVFIAAIEAIWLLHRSNRQSLKHLATIVPAVAALVGLALTPAFALRDLASSSLWSRSDEARAASELLTRIPKGSTVQADRSLSSFLVSEFETYSLNTPNSFRPDGNVGADFIVLDRRVWDLEEMSGVEYARASNPRFQYEVVFEEHGFTLLERVED
jgi:uncharacterized membrane protein